MDVVEADACKGARFLRNYDNHDIANDRYEERLERICGPRAADMLLVQFSHPGVDDRAAPEAAGFPSSAKSFNIPTTLDHLADGATRKLSNYVSIAGGQTITGAKTFSAWLTSSSGIVTGGDIYPSTDLGGSLGYSTRRFSNLNVQDISTRNINFKSSDNSATTGHLSFQAGYMILRSGSNISSSYKQLTFHESYGFYPDGTGVNLGYSGSTNRWATIYGVNGNLTGDLSMESASHIDIGPLRIEYDATNKALHITKVSSSDTNNYGLYTDGFIAAGGIQQSS